MTYVWNSSNNVGGEFAHVEGLRELAAGLRELPKVMENKILRGALRAAAEVVANEARYRCPVRTGQLKASIRVSTRVVNGRVICYVKAGSRYTVFRIGKKGRSTKDAYKTIGANGGVDYQAAHYAFWIEFGTSKMAARPFMRPAFESKRDQAIATFTEYVQRRLAVEVAGIRWHK